MNRLHYFSVFCFLFILSGAVFGQATMSVQTKNLILDLKKSGFENGRFSTELPVEIKQTYEIREKKGLMYTGALIVVDDQANETHFRSAGIYVNSQIGNIWSIQFPVTLIEELPNFPGIRHIETGVSVAPLLENEVKDIKADSVHLGVELPEGYTGKGVVIGVIDWGFDYTHPTFYDTSLTKLRLVRAWDQNKISGTPPEGYSYGAEYKSQEELLEAKHDTDYVFGPGTHGTHVAGIAGGNGGGSRFVGIAPEADLIFISLLRTSPTLVDAYKYIADYAASVGKPFVVNMSFGSHLGPHDGTLLENVAMDLLSGPGRIFVGSAGNNGDNDFHIKGNFNVSQDTLKTFIDFASPTQVAEMFGQAIPLWGETGKNFSSGLTIYDKNNNIITSTPFFNTQIPGSLDTTIYINNDSVVIRMIAVETFQSTFINNKPSIFYQISNYGMYPIELNIAAETGEVHGWNIIRMLNRYTNWGRDFLASPTGSGALPGYSSGDNEFAVGEPAGVGKEVITVGAYKAQRTLNNGNIVDGELAVFSSRGPTVDGRVKPDICGPGVGVISAINSYVPFSGIAAGSVNHDGRNYRFLGMSGTSMSGPAVAGVVALMLQANPNLTAREAKDIIKATARSDQHTGNIPSSGSNVWGWGKIDAHEAVKTVSQVLSISIPKPFIAGFNIYPNPSPGRVTIAFNNVEESELRLSVFDLSGRNVFSKRLNSYNGENQTLDFSYFENGLYIVKIEGKNSSSVAKMKILK